MPSSFCFPSANAYDASELAEFEQAFRSSGADFLVTTEKDVARINTGDPDRTAFLGRVPLFYVEIEQSVIQEESVLNEIIDRL